MGGNVDELKRQYNDFARQHDWQQALRVINKMISLRPSAVFFYRRGTVYVKLRKRKKAIADLQRALRLEPDLDKARQLLDKIEKLTTRAIPQIEREDEITVVELIEEDTPAPPARQKSPESFIDETQDFGRYRIKTEIGRGGMGRVYQAYDKGLDRTIALKVLLDGGKARHRDIQRFLREAKATAKLQHPHIVALHDIDSHDGFHFFTMDFIEGVSFKQFLQNSPAIVDVVTILGKIARAVHHAHEQGIIHRDLKPANIMIDAKGEPRVMDFGLAKFVFGEDDLSKTGEQMGTPAYMSPEQANGKKSDRRTDVYALGAMLYQALAGRPPFQGENHFNILFQILHADPVAPRRLNPDISEELEAISLKCLEKSPDKRYSSASALADDLDNFSHNRPISARPATAMTHMRKFLWRHRTQSLAVVAVLMAIIAGAIVSFSQWQRALEQKDLVEIGKTKAEYSEYKTTVRMAKITLAKAKEMVALQQWREAGALAGAGLELIHPYREKMFPGSSGKQEYELRSLRQQGRMLVQVAMREDGLLWQTESFAVAPLRSTYNPGKAIEIEKAPLKIAWSPDGRIIACACWDGAVRLWDTTSGQQRGTLNGHSDIVNDLAFHPHGDTLATAAADHLVQIWDLSTGKSKLQIRAHEDSVTAIAFSSDGSILYSASHDKSIRLWDSDTGKQLASYKSDSEILALAVSDNFLASASVDGVVALRDKSGKPVAEMTGHTDVVTTLKFAPHGDILASAGEDMSIILWSVPKGDVIRRLAGHTGAIAAIAFDAEGKWLASAGEDHNICLWDLSSTNPVRTIVGHGDIVSAVAFYPHGQILASASHDNTIRLWNTDNGHALSKVSGHSNAVWSVAFHPGENIIASASQDNTIRLWDAAMGREIRLLRGHTGAVNHVAFSGDGRLLASASDDKSIRVWNLANGEQLHKLLGHTGPINCTAFDPQGQILASASSDNTICLWDIATGRQLQQLTGHQKRVWSVAFHPDGRMLASASADHTVCLWEIDTGQKLQTLTGQSGPVVVVAFNSQGTLLAYACEDKNIRLWDIEKKQLVREITGHLGSVTDIAFRRDGKVIASCSDDETIRFWDVSSGKEIRQIPSRCGIFSIAFSPDGKKIAGSCVDGAVRLWQIKTSAVSQVIREPLAPHTVRFSPKGDNLAYVSLQTIKLWDARTKQSRILKQHDKIIYSLAFHPKGEMIAYTSAGGGIDLCDPTTGKTVRSLPGHDKITWRAAFSPNGRLLASSSKDRTIKLWDIATGKLLQTLHGHLQSVYCVTFSPDGRWLASASEDRTVKIWETSSGTLLDTIRHQQGVCIFATFSPKGRWLAFSSDRDVCIWDTLSKQLRVLRGHTGFIICLDFSPDGKSLASASYDRTIRLWDVQSGVQIDKLEGHDDVVFSVAYHPGGRLLASASEDKTIRLWNITAPATFHHSHIPSWAIEIAPAQKYMPLGGEFSLRADIAGVAIASALAETPKTTTKMLFGLAIDDLLSLEEHQLRRYLWDCSLDILEQMASRYADEGIALYYQENHRRSLDYLQMAVEISPQEICQRLRRELPDTCPMIAQRYVEQSRRTGDPLRRSKYLAIASQLDPENEEILRMIEEVGE